MSDLVFKNTLGKYWKNSTSYFCHLDTSCGDLVHWAGGGVSHIAEDGEHHTSAEDAVGSKSQ